MKFCNRSFDAITTCLWLEVLLDSIREEALDVLLDECISATSRARTYILLKLVRSLGACRTYDVSRESGAAWEVEKDDEGARKDERTGGKCRRVIVDADKKDVQARADDLRPTSDAYDLTCTSEDVHGEDNRY